MRNIRKSHPVALLYIADNCIYSYNRSYSQAVEQTSLVMHLDHLRMVYPIFTLFNHYIECVKIIVLFFRNYTIRLIFAKCNRWYWRSIFVDKIIHLFRSLGYKPISYNQLKESLKNSINKIKKEHY